MKILLLADHMESGGAETHLYELSRLLSLKGHFVTVLSFGGTIADALAKQGINQENYGTLPLLTLLRILQKQKPDVVHAHTRQSAFLCRLLLPFISFPIVFTAHAHFSVNPIKGALSFFPERTIAVSTDIASHLVKQFGVDSKRITIIENGIDTDRFCFKRNRIKSFHVVAISRLDKDCSLTASLLCHSAPMLSKKIPTLHITIIGGGSELKRIRELAAKANAACGRNIVSAIGQKSDVLPYLQSASLFIGVSRAALEAMSCGIPVILSGNEGYLGIAAGNILSIAEHGNFCARGYPKPSAKRLQRDIIKMFSDNELAFQAKTDGLRQICQYHTAEQMVEKTLQVYNAANFDAIKKRESDILLCGYYGYGNLGDELSLRAIYTRLSSRWQTESLDDKDSLRLSILTPKGIHYKQAKCIDRFRLQAVLKAIRNTGLVMLGGGSLLQNKTSNRSLFYYLSLLEIAHFFGVPTMLYAAGIGPIRGKIPQLICKHTLRKVDLITVRDPLSQSFLKDLDITDTVRMSADPVLLCQLPKTKSRGYLLAFVRKEEWRKALAILETSNKPIRLAVMDPKKDLSTTKKLALALSKQGKKVTVYASPSTSNILKLIAGAELVVSARLHALILAFCARVPFLGISDDPKIAAFSKTVYNGLSLPVTRETLGKHFKTKHETLSRLAQKDASYAIDLVKRRNCP